jgi:hypothetical protein
MKISILVGCLTLWVILFALAGIVEQSNAPQSGSSSFNLLTSLFQPTMQNSSGGFIGSAVAFVVNAAGFFLSVIKMIFLWFPSVWAGDYIWFWYLLCVPVGIGIVVSIVIIARGSSSS